MPEERVTAGLQTADQFREEDLNVAAELCSGLEDAGIFEDRGDVGAVVASARGDRHGVVVSDE
ncbi:hypothetical protein [Streptomyces sp. NBC_00826]|uniref:hypothetical protein n=1 Tax=Streptomyces sp. NBC_00826 TaxID=2975845 RepID=UPI00386B6C1B|nr:hypothetical protein OG832_35230 [Streptomyces sp. NBC_00826]